MTSAVDFHTHIFPEKIAERAIKGMSSESHLVPVLNGTEDALVQSMYESDSAEGEGVSLSVILPVATNPEKCRSMNRYALSINRKYENKSKRLISFAAVHPCAEDVKGLVKEIAEQGFKGIKLHPDYQGVYFDDRRFKDLVYYAECNNLITLTHAGLDYGYPYDVRCSPARALNLIRDVKPERLVLAHMGSNSLWKDCEEFLCGLGVYFDTAFVNGHISPEQFVRLVKKNGAGRILFATDSPWDDQKKALDFVRNLPLSESEKDMILSENALKLLGI